MSLRSLAPGPAGCLPALILLAGCGGEPTVVGESAPATPTYTNPAPTYAAPARPRAERRPETPAPEPSGPVVVRDASPEPEAEPEPPKAEPVAEAKPEPEPVRDDAYFAKLWAELPEPVADLPPPLEPLPAENLRPLRAELRTYLRKASGRHRLAKRLPDAGVPVNVWPHVEEYNAFEGEYGKHKPELHGLIERDLWLAEKLLEQDDPAVRESGLGLVRWAVVCAAQYIKDGRLAAAVAEVHLVPHLDAASDNRFSLVSRKSLMQVAAQAYDRGKFWERLEQASGEMIRLSGSDRRGADRWRTNLFRALDRQGRRAEAVTVLEDIHDPAMKHLRDYHMPDGTDSK